MADAHGERPVYVASLKGQVQVVGLLAGRGADIWAPDNAGVTPLWLAMRHGQVSTTWGRGERRQRKKWRRHVLLYLSVLPLRLFTYTAGVIFFPWCLPLFSFCLAYRHSPSYRSTLALRLCRHFLFFANNDAAFCIVWATTIQSFLLLSNNNL